MPCIVVAGDAVDIKSRRSPEYRPSTWRCRMEPGRLPAPCVAANPAAWKAYAVLADLPPDRLSGAEFLIDPNGWLRAIRRPGTAGEWHNRDKT